MTMFEQWCAHHAPGFWQDHHERLVDVHGTICLCSEQASKRIATSRRPIHHGGLMLARVKKYVTILPSGIVPLGAYMVRVEVNSASAWAVSCGKDVLDTSVIGTLPEQNTTVAITHGAFVVAIGVVTATTGRVIKVLCDTGKLLHM